MDVQTPLVSGSVEDTAAKYQQFHDALSDFHDEKSAFMRTIGNDAEPKPIEFLFAASFFWCFPFFRRTFDARPDHSPDEIEYYQHIYHTYFSSDITPNSYNQVFLNYCSNTVWKGFIALVGWILQISLTVTISLGLFLGLDNEQDDTNTTVWQDVADVDLNIMIIGIASSILLLFSVRDQFRGALISSRFYAWYPEIYGSYWFIFLLEAYSNFGLSMYLFFLNAIIILTSEDATDAVLNSVAIFFVAEVDEYLIPDYNSDDTVENFFVMELFRHYCQRNPEVGVDFESTVDEVKAAGNIIWRKQH